MSKKIITLAFIFVFLVLVKGTYAQSLGISLINGPKDIFNHNIPLDLTLSSDIDLSTVKVQWVLPYGIKQINGENIDYTTTISSTGPLYDHIVVYPTFAGTFPVTANVSGVYRGDPFNKSTTVNLVVDDNLNVVDNSNTSTLLTILHILGSVVCFVVFVFLMKDVYNYLSFRFKTWLDKEA